MKLSLHKDFCVWLVSPNDGKVRKLRFSLLKAIGVSFGAALVVGAFLYVAGDYTRMQIAKARQHFSLRRLASERDALKQLNHSLSEDLEGLKTDKLRATNYQRSIRERLDKLSALVDSVTAMGFSGGGTAGRRQYGDNRAKRDEQKGLGGPEVDYCAPGNADCRQQALGEPNGPKASLRPDFQKSAAVADPDGVVKELESSIAVLGAVPMGIPVKGGVNSSYGMRLSPFGRRLRMHQGVDLAGQYGQSVHATAGGKVLEVRRDYAYGLRVDVRHSDEVTTRYAHLSRAMVAPGQRIERGQVIGKIGSSGMSTGPHLHYEVLVGHRSKNPSRLMELGGKIKKAIKQILA